MKKWMKRLAIGFGALLAVLLLAIVLLPMFINVDKYRPQILEAVNQNINGKAELGKLSLSLWGRIRVDADGFVLSDARSQKVVSVKEVHFDLPLMSILLGAPSVQFKMNHPELLVSKDKKGQLNVLTLMKPSKGPLAPAEPTEPSSGSSSLPGIATRAKLDVEMLQAHLTYRDEATALNAEIKDLNLVVHDLSMGQPTNIELSAQLDTRMGKTMTVKGPAKMSAHLVPHFEGSELKSAEASWKIDLSALEIDMPTLFHKGKNIPAHAEGQGKLVGKVFDLTAFALRFHNAEIESSGRIELADVEAKKPLSMKIGVRAKPIALKPWTELVPMLATYELGGSASFNADLSGTSENPQYRADLAVQRLTAKAPMLKAQPVIDAEMRVVTDRIDDLKLRMKAPGNDLSVTGKVIGFAAPKIEINAVSPGMDLDQWIDFPAPAAKKSSSAPAPAGGKTKTADYDSLLAPVRENPMLAKASATVNARIAFIKAYQVRMNDISTRTTFKDLSLAIESFKMGIFSGTVASSARLNMAPRTPTYRMDLGVTALDLKQAVASQMALFKNTLTGKLSMKMDATGASLNPDPAKKNLVAKGNFAVADGTFATIDIGKVATEAIGKAMAGLSGQIPQLKNTKLNPPPNSESKYSKIASDFTIKDGVFTAPNFVAVSLPGKGLDLQGSTRVGLMDYALKADWVVIDTHNLTTARNLTVDQAGVRVEHILANGNDPVKLPIQVSGTLFEPKPSYTSVPEALGKVALNNISKAVQGKVKSEVQKKAQGAIQDAMKGLGKKLFGK